MATEDEFTGDEDTSEDAGSDDVELTEIDDIADLDSDDDDDDDIDDIAVIAGAADDDTSDDDDATAADDGDDDDDDDDDDDEPAEVVEDDEEIEDDEEDEEEEESLDVLLAREKVLDEDVARRGRPTSTPVTVGAGEFTCRSCFLVKRRAQLADEDELICFDCA